MDKTVELTLEQQFDLCSFKTQVQQMSREQAQEFLVEFYEMTMVREALWRKLIKEQWGIETPPKNK